MSGQLVIRKDQSSWDEVQVAALRQLGIENATQGDMDLFFHQAKRTGLDPFTRQVYMIGRRDNRSNTTRYTIQASIDGLRVIAQRSTEYAGQTPTYWCGPDGVWTDVWLQSYPPMAAKVGVYRKGFVEALWATAKFSSYAVYYDNGQTLSPMWKKMPDLMIGKVAEALALRKAFPQDLSGIYSTEEMEQANATVEVTATLGTSTTPAQAPSQITEPKPVVWLDVMKQIDEVKTIEDVRKLWTDNKAHLDSPIEIEGVTIGATLRLILQEKSATFKSAEEVEANNLAEAQRVETEAIRGTQPLVDGESGGGWV